MKTTTMNVADLEVCERTRVRKQRPKETSDIVEEYAEGYKCGLIVEPLDVFQEPGTERYVVADGEHRLLALRKAKIKQVECRIHKGDEIAALDYAIECNQTHGVRLTKADRYHAFERIMDTELKDKYRNDTELSEKLRVSKATIARYKAEWRKSAGGNEKAKKQADKSAKKNTGKNRSENTSPQTVSTDNVPSKSKQKQKPAKPKTESKSDESDGWTKADEDSASAILDQLAVLGEVWKKATRPAQLHTADVIRKTMKDMA